MIDKNLKISTMNLIDQLWIGNIAIKRSAKNYVLTKKVMLGPG